MENNIIDEIDVISDEINEPFANPYPNWVFSDIKMEKTEPLKLTTNDSVQIMKNE